MWSLLTVLTAWSALSIPSALAGRRFDPFDGLRPHLSKRRLDILNAETPSGAASTRRDEPLTFGNGTIEQYIDHNKPELGKFPMRYWWNTTYYKGEGFPIVIGNMGELPGDPAWTDDHTMAGQIAKRIGAATLMVEHRFFGGSTPFTGMTAENLSYLTVEQAAADYARLPCELELPFDPNRSSSAPGAPWIYIGGSYAGSLASYIEKLHPGSYWINYASSATTQAVWDYWYYSKPMEKYMPRNCSNDLQAIFKKVDSVLTHGTTEEQHDLKAMFGLQDLEYPDDFGTTLSLFIVKQWQFMSLDDEETSGENGFYKLCDAVEGVTRNSSGSTYITDSGVGVELALPNYAAWYKESFLYELCSSIGQPDWTDPYDARCLDTHNASSPYYTDRTYTGRDGVPYTWMICTWFFGNPTGPPPDETSIVSRFMTPEHWLNWCQLHFPDYDFSNTRATLEEFNAKTGGWDSTGNQRFFWTNGALDVWSEDGVASHYRPGGPFLGNDKVRSIVIPGANHVDDLYIKSGRLNSDVAAAQQEILDQIVQWTKEFYEEKGLEFNL